MTASLSKRLCMLIIHRDTPELRYYVLSHDFIAFRMDHDISMGILLIFTQRGQGQWSTYHLMSTILHCDWLVFHNNL